MEEEKDKEINETISNKQRWNDNFSKRHSDIDANDEEAYYGAINDDYDAYDEQIRGYEEDNQRVADMLKENPAFAQMLVAAHNGGNPWQVLARIGGEPLLELMKNPEDEELAKTVLDGMNEYADKVKESKALEEEASANIGPSVDALMAVVEENGLDNDKADELCTLWQTIQQDALVNKVTKETWEMLAKAVMHDENVAAAGTDGEMRGKNAKMQVDKNHILKGNSPMTMRGQGGGPRSEGEGGSNGGFDIPPSIWQK